MKKLLLFLPLLAGCFTSAPQVPVNWMIEWRPGADGPAHAGETLPLTLRVSDIYVRAPYAGSRLAVLRADGSLAFDPYNVFAASPSQLLRGAAYDALARTGRFAHVIDHSSQASADLDAEIAVTRLALDCRAKGRCDALVELSLAFIAKGCVICVAPGRAAVPVEEGNFSDGFSRAFSDALANAAVTLKSEMVRP